MRLHAVRTADDQYGIIQHLHGALGLRRKIHMTGRVEQRDLGIAEGKPRLLGKNRDAAGALQRIMVEKSVAVVDAPQLPQRSGAVEQRLGKCCFPRVDLREYADDQMLHCHRASVVWFIKEPPCVNALLESCRKIRYTVRRIHEGSFDHV